MRRGEQASRQRIWFELSDGSTLHPFEDYGWRLASLEASPPEPKTYRVEIEGRNGALDMSAWAGRIFYNDREIKMEFRAYSRADKNPIYALLGQTVKIFFSGEPDFYYDGRVDKIETKDNFRVCDLTLTCTCYPYRKRVTETVVSASSTGAAITVALRAALEAVTPKITTSAAVASIAFGGATYTLSGAQTNIELDGLIIPPEGGTATVTGDGETAFTVSFRWRDGEF